MNMLDATNHPKPLVYIIAKCQILFSVLSRTSLIFMRRHRGLFRLGCRLALARTPDAMSNNLPETKNPQQAGSGFPI